jgi:hypothetical protein
MCSVELNMATIIGTTLTGKLAHDGEFLSKSSFSASICFLPPRVQDEIR